MRGAMRRSRGVTRMATRPQVEPQPAQGIHGGDEEPVLDIALDQYGTTIAGLLRIVPATQVMSAPTIRSASIPYTTIRAQPRSAQRLRSGSRAAPRSGCPALRQSNE